jgi:hypothetical protein
MLITFITLSKSKLLIKMNKLILLLFTICICCAGAYAQNAAVKDGLKISADKHYLTDAKTGAPVFLLATTAWNINALTYHEIDTLIQSVAGNGFNSIMFTLDFYPQADEANIYGQKAYTGPEKTDLNPEYFKYCDYIIELCTRKGLYPMIYTMWSGKTAGIMNTYTTAQLNTLGKKIGTRYKNYRNVILVAGGESSPPYIDTVRVDAMGNGLREGSEGHNLISVHPCSPHSNSEFYEQQPWLDFYMTQAKSNLSGITYDFTKAITKDHDLNQIKPTMLAEHRYESGTTEDPIIQRRTLYLSVFAGGFGYAYGHNALWQMTPHTAQPWMLKSWAAGVKDWKEALNTEAVKQLHHIKSLLYAYPYLQRIPDQGLVLAGQGDSIINKVQVMRDGNTGQKNATYVMAYISVPKTITINTWVISSNKLNAYWFNPRTGLSEVIKQKFKNTGNYTPETKTDKQDWVLVIDDASKKYNLPFKIDN